MVLLKYYIGNVYRCLAFSDKERALSFAQSKGLNEHEYTIIEPIINKPKGLFESLGSILKPF